MNIDQTVLSLIWDHIVQAAFSINRQEEQTSKVLTGGLMVRPGLIVLHYTITVLLCI